MSESTSPRLPRRHREPVSAVVGFDDSARLTDALDNSSLSGGPRELNHLGDGGHRPPLLRVIGAEHRVAPPSPDGLRLQEAPETTGDLVLMADGIPCRGMKEGHTPLSEEPTDGLAELDPPFAVPYGRHQIAVDESPSEHRLVTIRMTDSGFEGGTPEPPERYPDEGALPAAQRFMPQRSCRLSQAEGDLPVIRTTKPDVVRRELCEESLIARRERSALNLSEGVTEEDRGDHGVVVGRLGSGVPDRTTCEVRLVAQGVATPLSVKLT